MSEYRTRARAVYEKGVAERGNFTPTGAPLQVYNFWARHAKHVPARENFCHFWRVVAIWAPLMGLKLAGSKAGNFLGDQAEKTPVQIALVALYLGLAVLFATMGGGALLTAGFMLALPAAAAGLACSVCIIDDVENQDSKPNPLYYVGALAGLPLAALILGGWGIFRLHKKYWNSEWNDIVAGLFAIAGLCAIGGLVIAALVAAWLAVGTWAFLAMVGATLVGMAVAAGILFGIATFVQGRRAVRKERREKAERERLYEEVDENTEFTYPRQPPMIVRFGSGLADFLILAFQVVRTKKWKICPIVEVPSQRDAA